MVAGGYMTDGKSGNPALDMALKLAIDDIETAQLEDVEKMQKKIKEPEIGSFERAARAFGGSLMMPKPGDS